MTTSKWYIRIIYILLLLILALQIYSIRKVKYYQVDNVATWEAYSKSMDHLTSIVYRLEYKVDAITEAVEGADKAVSPTE